MGALLSTLCVALGFEGTMQDSRAEHPRAAFLQHFELEAVHRIERGPCFERRGHLAAACHDRQTSNGAITDERLERLLVFGKKPTEGGRRRCAPDVGRRG
jgi:hypothetical protein